MQIPRPKSKFVLIAATVLSLFACEEKSSERIDDLTARWPRAKFVDNIYCTKVSLYVYKYLQETKVENTPMSPYYIQTDSIVYRKDEAERVLVPIGTSIRIRESWITHDKTSGNLVLFYGEVLDGVERDDLVYLNRLVIGSTAIDEFKGRIDLSYVAEW